MLQMTITTIGSPLDKAKEVIPCINEGLKAAIEFWHAKMLPGHFWPSAYAKYGSVYRSRTNRYNRRKMNRFGHQRPLVWSGTLCRDVTRSIRITMLKTKADVRGTMRAMALNFSGRRNMPDMRAEMMATTFDQETQLGDLATNVAMKELERIGPTRVTYIGATATSHLARASA